MRSTNIYIQFKGINNSSEVKPWIISTVYELCKITLSSGLPSYLFVLSQCSSNFNVHKNHLGILLKCGFYLIGLRWDLGFCISNKFPGMVFRSHFWAGSYWMIMNYKTAWLLRPSGTKELMNMEIHKDKFPNRGWNTELNAQWEDNYFLK